jgi:TonB family protein
LPEDIADAQRSEQSCSVRPVSGCCNLPVIPNRYDPSDRGDQSNRRPPEFLISSAVAQGLLLHSVEPDYPGELKNSGASGEVLCRVVIDKHGKTSRVTPITSVEAKISEAAIQAVKQWTFNPYLLNGKPVNVTTVVSVPFKFVRQTKTSSLIPSPSPAPVKRLRISPDVARNSITKTEGPQYPVEAKKKHLMDDVILGFIIDKEGEVADLTVVRGDPILAQAAVEAVQQWQYRPFLLNGEPVEVETTAKIIFRM